MINSSTIFFALVGGVVPALIWLAYWLFEDSKRPEPRGYIARTFILGMLAVPLVLPFQEAVDRFFPGTVFAAILLWSALEELFKFAAAYSGGLGSREADEPVDKVIYMITAALGFTALENVLYIANPLLEADIAGSVLTGNLRFIGASILHAVASGLVGAALGMAFYKKFWTRFLWGSLALLLAILYHAAFNIGLLRSTRVSTAVTFGAVWASVAILLLVFEMVKAVRRPVSTASPSHTDRSRDII